MKTKYKPCGFYYTDQIIRDCYGRLKIKTIPDSNTADKPGSGTGMCLIVNEYGDGTWSGT